LVIGTKRVAEEVWSAEVENWEHVKHLRIVTISGTTAQRKAALAEDADVYTIGRDNIAWLCGLYGGLKLPFDMLVIDESSSFKNQNSVRFKALRKVAPSFKRVVLLTGTPAPNGLLDLWPQIYLLDQGQRLGKTITYYRDEYFIRNRSGFGYNIRDSSEDRIIKRIGDICLSMKATDYLDMPDKIENVVSINLPEDLRKRYRDFERERILDIVGEDGHGEVTAPNAAALCNKLLQFANGAVYDEDRVVHEIHDLKLDAIEEIIENNNGKPVLIAWAYQHDRDRLLKRLKKYKPVQFKTAKHSKQWNAGEIQVLLMHPASGGHGLNLQAGGNTLVWFGLTWSLELYQQLIARLWRQGQTANSVVIHLLVAAGTWDTKVMKRLKEKDETQETLLQAVKAKINHFLKTTK
jgi:SNF2 family DNA or RNA helicase